MNSTQPEPLDIVFLARPSCRTVAYCSVMRNLGLYPRQVVWLQGDMPFFSKLQDEDQRHGYSQHYFDLSLEPLAWLRSCGAQVFMAVTHDVNAPEVIALIQNCTAPALLFSAAGIVAPDTLATGKCFIHVHPGLLPDYRGSTCFYYALLEEGCVGASAFIMNAGIDDGLLLERSRFDINLRIQEDQYLFMDHILDPYIRAQVLKRVLTRLHAGAGIQGYANRASNRPACYVMHPLLRALAVKRLNSCFDPDRPDGLIEHAVPEESP